MKKMRRAALLCFSAVVYSSTAQEAIGEETPREPCTQEIAEAADQKKLCCTSEQEAIAAGADGDCGFDCLAEQYLLSLPDGNPGYCEPKPCPDTTNVQNAFAAGDFIRDGNCGFECYDGYSKNQAGTACLPEGDCKTNVENATATGTPERGDCGFECKTYYQKSGDGKSCVPMYCTSQVANSQGTGMLKDNDCGFVCDEDFEKVGGECRPVPCTTDVENAVATGTSEAEDDCGYVCKAGFAKHKTNNLCIEMSAGEGQTKNTEAVEEGEIRQMQVPSGGKMGESAGEADATTEPQKTSPAGKMVTSVVWLVLLGAPFWQ